MGHQFRQHVPPLPCQDARPAYLGARLPRKIEVWADPTALKKNIDAFPAPVADPTVEGDISALRAEGAASVWGDPGNKMVVLLEQDACHWDNPTGAWQTLRESLYRDTGEGEKEKRLQEGVWWWAEKIYGSTVRRARATRWMQEQSEHAFGVVCLLLLSPTRQHGLEQETVRPLVRASHRAKDSHYPPRKMDISKLASSFRASL
ncbi:hypothetical protein B0H10DRAFT_1939933 [Mycena sp. CBHHK59/15]|nr:hypothetical protein B0H10DRAFT_1939933 [Mycena sp. CBHHK59/15]